MEQRAARCISWIGWSRVVSAVAAGSVVLGSACGQTPRQQGAQPDDLLAVAQRLDELVDQAAARLQQGDAEGARAACQQALAAATLATATVEQLAATAGPLWRLGFLAHRTGDLRAAHSAWEAVLAHRGRTLPDDHAELQKARLNLASTKYALGDLAGARALQEQVLAVFARTLPDDDAELQKARLNLASTKHALGDLAGARALQEQVLAVFARTLPDDHPHLQAARQNLAATRRVLGDLQGALALEEQVLAIRSRTLPDDHPDLQLARGNLANTRLLLGDVRGALALQEQVLAIRSRTLPDDHPDLQAARQNLAATRRLLGDLPGALALEEQVLAIRSRTLPDDHPDLQAARNNLATTRKALGDLPGALALEEQVLAIRSRTLPDDHPDLQAARLNLAGTKRDLGDLQAALELEDKVCTIFARTLPDDHPALQAARLSLASTRFRLGDLPQALALQAQVVAAYTRTLPHDHPDLQAARNNLAITQRMLGDLPGALLLQEQILAVCSRTLPDDHPDLQAARSNLAITKGALGDLPGASTLQEQVFAVCSRTLPDDHPDLQAARTNLANTRQRLGDLQGALALHERVFGMRSRTLPDDHPDLQEARHNLAVTRVLLGDLQGALALQEQVLAACARTLPDDHPHLQAARHSLAGTRFRLGDLPGALRLQEQVLAVRSRTLPEDHPDLQQTRQNLAVTKRMLGDLPGALAQEQQIVAVRSRTLPDDHPDLQAARNNLALTLRELGRLQPARELQEQVLAVRSRTLPDDHPQRQTARLNLALTRFLGGDLPAAAALVRAAVSGARAHLSHSILSTRDATQRARTAALPLSYAGSLLDANAASGDTPALTAELVAALGAESLALLSAIRGAETHTVALLRDAVAKDQATFAELTRTIRRASQDLEDAMALPAAGRTDATGRHRSRDDAILAATLARDAAERAIHDTVPAELRTTPSIQALIAGLAADEAAVAFLTYTHWTIDPEQPGIPAEQQRFAAFVLSATGQVSWHRLAPVAAIEALISGIRRDAAAGVRLADRSPATDTSPGRDPDTAGASDTLTPRLTALRDQLLAPVLATLPTSTRRIILSPADEMLLAPIEDLPLADGRLFADAFDVQTVPTLRLLAQQPVDRVTATSAVLVGGIDYDRQPAQPARVVPDAATPILEPSGTAAATTGHTTPTGQQTGTRGFSPLPGTAAEVQQLEQLFAARFPSGTSTVLRGTDASELAFVVQAPGKTFLHLATHGYFAPEAAWRAAAAPDQSPLARFDSDPLDRGGQLSPFSLAGIALAGANQPPDALGRREGILTAQELARIDLTACRLATLSACNTTLGVRRGGTGLASLRQAFHAAGARCVLATLWEVDDAETQRLMADFYTRSWQHGEAPRLALRAAKHAARARGAAFRDWAGWWLTGR